MVPVPAHVAKPTQKLRAVPCASVQATEDAARKYIAVNSIVATVINEFRALIAATATAALVVISINPRIENCICSPVEKVLPREWPEILSLWRD